MKRVYGLTGGIACGKSTVGRVFAANGAALIDADQIARDVVALGTPGLAAVLQHFGPECALDDGTLNRERVGEIVFADAEERAALNRILHPLIAQESVRRIAEAMADEPAPIFYEAALLVESGAYRQYAGLIVVACDPEIQLRRIMERDELTREEAARRVSAQLPVADKVRVATHVIWNNGSLDDLEREALSTLACLRSAGVDPAADDRSLPPVE